MTNKICVLGDTHFGVRNDLSLFHNHFAKFYDMLFEHLQTAGIKQIFQLGDLWDRRKYVNFNTLNQAKRYFFDRALECGIEIHTLVGNHDIYYRESVEVNSSSLVLGEYDNVHVYTEPTQVKVGKTTIDMIPWICESNKDAVMRFMKKSKSDLCFGHFEIATFSMYRGIESHGGLPVDMFSKYELVCSGHYHTKSDKENITYVGTPYEMTWQDYNDPKGYHFFDLESRELTFFQNPYTIFHKLEYNDTAEVVNLDSLDLKDLFVRLVVVNKTNLYKFDQFVSKLYSKGCYEVKILEDMSEFQDGEIGEEINLEDTMDVLDHYIDSIDTDADKDQIKTFIKSLYIEAVNTEVV